MVNSVSMILQTAKQKARNTGFEIVQDYRDETGPYATLVKYDGEPFALVAKEYAFKGMASFMKGVVHEAEENDLTLLFYEGDTGNATVFNAQHVRLNGSPSTGKSKTKQTEWIELPLDDGAPLRGYLEGTERPTRLSGDNAELTQFA